MDKVYQYLKECKLEIIGESKLPTCVYITTDNGASYKYEGGKLHRFIRSKAVDGNLFNVLRSTWEMVEI